MQKQLFHIQLLNQNLFYGHTLHPPVMTPAAQCDLSCILHISLDNLQDVLFGHLQIERWWRELHDRFEQYFKHELSWLLNQGHYNPQDETDRYP